MDSSSQPPQHPSSGQVGTGAPVQAVSAVAATSGLRRGRPPFRVILEQPFGMPRKILFVLLLLALGVSVLFNFGLIGAYLSYVQTDPAITEKLHSGSAHKSSKIAIIEVKGAILDSEGFVKRQINRVKKDDDVKAVILRVDSPGGSVTASHYIYHHLKQLRKERDIPMVVSMGGMAASGGYYISMAVGDAKDTIFAEETTWTGSVGVIIPSYDLSELLDSWKIRDRSFVSGPLKQMGSPTRQLDGPQREKEELKLQELVNESFAGFLDVVAYGRPALKENTEAMDEIITGQIFTAKQALKLGMVDKLGYIEDAIGRAAELASLSRDQYRVVRYERPISVVEAALGGGSQSSSFDMAGLLDLTAPRAYYLCTWLPAVAINRIGH